MGEVRRIRAAVVGAGPAGLAAAAMLERRGVSAVVFERDSIASSWRGHYDRLHLHTHRLLSGLPGCRLSSRRGPWVARAGVVEYLENYARHHAVDARTGVEVHRVDAGTDGWRLRTSRGCLDARAVVIATGYNAVPAMPAWPGVESFTGEILHAARYRSGARFAGRDVLVVGAGNTGAEIAADLAEQGAARVRIAVRTPPQVLLRDVGGMPTQLFGILLHRLPAGLTDPIAAVVQRVTVGDLRPYGLPAPQRGPFSDFRRRGAVPVLDVGLVEALKRREVEVVRDVVGFQRPRVLLAGGVAIEPEVVVAATGYRSGLESLVGHLGLLDGRGLPQRPGAAEDAAALVCTSSATGPRSAGCCGRSASRRGASRARSAPPSGALKPGQRNFVGHRNCSRGPAVTASEGLTGRSAAAGRR